MTVRKPDDVDAGQPSASGPSQAHTSPPLRKTAAQQAEVRKRGDEFRNVVGDVKKDRKPSKKGDGDARGRSWGGKQRSKRLRPPMSQHKNEDGQRAEERGRQRSRC